ncbi:hypothetical protein [Arcanobacterium phocae]|uniref:Tetratricopeptide repeat-containing protein n=1 Tax=Arcanobacterium phocae TaxID=131112 RepID=A0A1H2LL89_9ACTO|nr:hypothetical protein [Arcanobacterium phocae]SDU81515.1 hypothetical protein SAMN04489737_1539 [Arcanobacterium phocae]
MAFIDLIEQLAEESSPLVDRAGQLRVDLDSDPNNQEAFEELISLIRKLGQSSPTADPLTADDVQHRKTPVKLVLLALSEDLASDSRAWYPLIQLAKITIDDDPAAAVHQIEVAAAREESGRALAEGIHLLVEADQPDTAMQVGMGRWNPENDIPDVGIELIKAAVETGKISDAQRFLTALEQHHPGNQDVLDLHAFIAEAE